MTPYVVGIAGGSGSGKSTLARELIARLGPRVLHVEHDRYYRSLPAGKRPIEHNWDEPAALETALLVEHLDALRAGQPAVLPVYEFATHCRAAHTHRVVPAPIVLVEGILVLTEPDLRDRLDLSVFVDVDDDIRLIRRILRDRKERAWSTELTIEQYLRTVRPMHAAWVAPSRDYAELVVDGTAPIPTLADEVVDYLPLG